MLRKDPPPIPPRGNGLYTPKPPPYPKPKSILKPNFPPYFPKGSSHVNDKNPDFSKPVFYTPDNTPPNSGHNTPVKNPTPTEMLYRKNSKGEFIMFKPKDLEDKLEAKAKRLGKKYY